MASQPDVNVDGLSGLDIHYSMTNGPGRPSMDQVSDGWRQMVGKYAETQARVEALLNTVHATWDGAGANAAHSAISPLGDWANNASEAATTAQTAVATQADSFSRASNSVEKMENIPDTRFFGIIDNGHDDALAENNRRTAINRDVMRGYQGSTSSAVSTLPQFAIPVDVGTDLQQAPPPGATSSGGSGASNLISSGRGGGDASGGTPTLGTAVPPYGAHPAGQAAAQFSSPSAPNPPQQGGWSQSDHSAGKALPGGRSGSQYPGTQTGAGTYPPGEAAGGTSSGYYPADVRAASAAPVESARGGLNAGPGATGYGTGGTGYGTGLNAGGNGSSGGGSGAYGGGAGGYGSGGFGPGSAGSAGSAETSGSPAYGRGGGGALSGGGQSGVGPNTGEAGLRGGASSGAAGGGGASGRGAGMGGMGGMGAGRGGSDDAEHETPDFLKTEELFGCTVTYSPPVIGAEPPDRR